MFFSHLIFSCLLFFFNLVDATHLDAISNLLIGSRGVSGWTGPARPQWTLGAPCSLSESAPLGILSARAAGLPRAGAADGRGHPGLGHHRLERADINHPDLHPLQPHPGGLKLSKKLFQQYYKILKKAHQKEALKFQNSLKFKLF